MGGEVGANVQKIFSYGHRNSIGMDFEPRSGHLWLQENGDDTFTELNRVEPGMNGGWIQIMGPVSRIAQFSYDQVVGPQAIRIGIWAYLVVGARLGSLKVTAA